MSTQNEAITQKSDRDAGTGEVYGCHCWLLLSTMTGGVFLEECGSKLFMLI